MSFNIFIAKYLSSRLRDTRGQTTQAIIRPGIFDEARKYFYSFPQVWVTVLIAADDPRDRKLA